MSARDVLRERIAAAIQLSLDGEPMSVTDDDYRLAGDLMPLFADVWSEGADFGSSGLNAGIRPGEFEEAGDNPYRGGDDA